MTQFTALIDDNNLCGEAPIWDAERRRLYWVDILGHKLFSYDWIANRREILLENFEISGCAINHPSGLVLTSSSGVWLWEGAGYQPVLVADHVDNTKLQLNDCIADPQGRVLSGSCFYTSDQKYALGHLVCVETDGTARILDEGFHLANGLGFSPDGRTLYFADSVERVIYSYSYDPAQGTAFNRRIFVRVDAKAGLPDGLTVDAEGFVWSAEWYGSCIKRYDPDGKLQDKLMVPAKQVSSLAFGGSDLTSIFVTSAAKPEPMPVMPPGYDPESGYIGGAVFVVNQHVAGRPEFKSTICVDHRSRA